MKLDWKGVMPAITTCFDENLQIDHELTKRHVEWLVESGSTGIVCNGSLGEGATLSMDEKIALWKTCVEAVGERVPIVAAIAAASTADAVEQAQKAEAAGCRGLMILPPYIYQGDWREVKYHITEVFRATRLSAMLYNNPIAYGTDFTPAHIAELASEIENLHAVKESSGDVRRITAIRALLADKIAVFVGLDDAIVEGVNAGAVGWIAGFVSAFPKESIALFNYAMNGEREKAAELYQWFLPILRLDTVPKFVQLIKFVQAEVGMGSARVRPPRLELTGAELEAMKRLVKETLENRPQIADAAA